MGRGTVAEGDGGGAATSRHSPSVSDYAAATSPSLRDREDLSLRFSLKPTHRSRPLRYPARANQITCRAPLPPARARTTTSSTAKPAAVSRRVNCASRAADQQGRTPPGRSPALDPTHIATGPSVAVRVDPGGSRIMIHKTTTNNTASIAQQNNN